VLPLLLGFAWALLLYFFAGVVIYLLLALLVGCMLALTFWLASQTGWFDADAVHWLSQLSANITSVSDLSGLRDLGSELSSELGSELSSGIQLGAGAGGAGDAGAGGAGAGGGDLLGKAVSDELIYYQLGAVLSTVATAAVLMLLCFWGRCIRRCIAIVQETAKVFRALPVLVALGLGDPNPNP
jgi:hypothetical protein